MSRLCLSSLSLPTSAFISVSLVRDLFPSVVFVDRESWWNVREERKRMEVHNDCNARKRGCKWKESVVSDNCLSVCLFMAFLYAMLLCCDFETETRCVVCFSFAVLSSAQEFAMIPRYALYFILDFVCYSVFSTVPSALGLSCALSSFPWCCSETSLASTTRHLKPS